MDDLESRSVGPEEGYRITEVVAMLGVSRNTVKKMMAEGTLEYWQIEPKYAKKAGVEYRISTKSVAAYMMKNKLGLEDADRVMVLLLSAFDRQIAQTNKLIKSIERLTYQLELQNREKNTDAQLQDTV